MKKILLRLLLGLCFATPAALITIAVGQADYAFQADPDGDCQGCHEIIQTHWSESAHGQAIDDPIFQQAWFEAGQPVECLPCHTTGFDPDTGTWDSDGVGCVSCHFPSPENHPDEVMPTELSSRLCGRCHLDTHKDWSDSAHAQEDMSCVACHSGHTTDIRAENAQELCRACHRDEVHFYSYTAHFETGLLCTDCHLSVTDTQMGEGHGARKHTFSVGNELCADCHGEELHTLVMRTKDTGDTLVQSGVVPLMQDSLTSPEPSPVSPWGFSLLAGLFGMAFGMILAPWLERWYRKTTLNGR